MHLYIDKQMKYLMRYTIRLIIHLSIISNVYLSILGIELLVLSF